MWGFFKSSPAKDARCPSEEERQLTRELEASRARAKNERRRLQAAQIDVKTATVELMLSGVVQDRKR